MRNALSRHASPRRPAVVLLHSSASSSRQWQALTESLQPAFEVHAIDLHGHGGRGMPRGGSLALADDAALVEPILVRAGAAHLVGHSYGAAVALKVAALHPRAVRSVTAYEPVLFRWLLDDDASRYEAKDVTAVAADIADRLARDLAHLAAQRFIDFWSGAGAWDSMPARTRGAVDACMQVVSRQFDALIGEPLDARQVAGLGMPMVFMSGARTVAVTRRIAHLLRLALPHALHEVMPDMGHMGPVTHAAEVNARIARFLHVHAFEKQGVET